MPFKDKAVRNEKQKVYRKTYVSKAENRKTQQLATANWRRKNPEKSYKINRTAYLKKHYNMTYEDYQDLLEQGDFKCWVCKKEQEHFVKNLNVDHDHLTGEVRGLLCYTCNRQVIGKHRDPEIFLHAYEYLKKKHPPFIVPENFLKGIKRKRKHKP